MSTASGNPLNSDFVIMVAGISPFCPGIVNLHTSFLKHKEMSYAIGLNFMKSAVKPMIIGVPISLPADID